MSSENGQAPDAAYNLRFKSDMYRLWHAGRFGNKLRTWNTYEEILADVSAGRCSPHQTFTMRTKQGGGGHTEYDVSLDRIPDVQHKWGTTGTTRAFITFNESAPDDCLTMQGQVLRDIGGLTLFYSFEKKKMNDALRRYGKQARGFEARWLLQQHLIGPSYDDLENLMNDFPDCVIEFGCYATELGNCPNRNTVFWEVRDY